MCLAAFERARGACSFQFGLLLTINCRRRHTHAESPKSARCMPSLFFTLAHSSNTHQRRSLLLTHCTFIANNKLSPLTCPPTLSFFDLIIRLATLSHRKYIIIYAAWCDLFALSLHCCCADNATFLLHYYFTMLISFDCCRFFSK